MKGTGKKKEIEGKRRNRRKERGKEQGRDRRMSDGGR